MTTTTTTTLQQQKLAFISQGVAPPPWSRLILECNGVITLKVKLYHLICTRIEILVDLMGLLLCISCISAFFKLSSEEHDRLHHPSLPPIFYSHCFPFTLITVNIVFLVNTLRHVPASC